MSKMIPQATVDAMRQMVDVSVGNYGIDCTLYVPTNLDTVMSYDVYVKPTDYVYTTYSTIVWIDWKPDKHKLRKLGLFVEDDLPIIAWFPNKIANVNVDITVKSWFSIGVQYIPANMDTEKFEIIDVLIPGMHERVITKYFKIAPRRVKT